jgi:hypothetical protein
VTRLLRIGPTARALLALALTLAVLAPSSRAASSSAPELERLTLPDARSLMIERNRELQLARNATAGAEADVTIAGKPGQWREIGGLRFDLAGKHALVGDEPVVSDRDRGRAECTRSAREPAEEQARARGRDGAQHSRRGLPPRRSARRRHGVSPPQRRAQPRLNAHVAQLG